MRRATGIVVVTACMLAAVPWTFILTGTDLMFVLFALAPPLVLASGLGFKSLRGQDAIRLSQ